ncbi:hypothetical protein Micbo1qcDRAFT_198879 [Microdochium bolleyi]|uniref:Xylanolytic transcriptional activator regulatory domain-containing protein n=1 Tax=Microdochium bolleyi TaxID=196109 RepID=A0A136IK33_9PEZI|nr:hypothetical protein Micbo1qcDRAFT_198879 [Microdochium bolleyi]
MSGIPHLSPSSGEHGRIPRACESCRRRKRKSGAGEPTTHTWIARWSIANVWPGAQRPRTGLARTVQLEEQVTVLRDYVRQLELAAGTGRRPAQVTDLLHNKDAAEEDGGDETTAAIPGGVPMMAKARGTAGEGARARDSKSSETPIDDVCSVMWKVSIDDDGTCSVVGPSGNFCGPTAEVRGSPPLPATPELVDDEGCPAHELLEHFAGHINAVHHYVDEEVLVTLEPALQPTASRSLLRCAVLAAAALFADRPRAARERQSLVYAQVAAAAAAECCRKHPCATTVSALAVMTWRELALDNTMAASLYNGKLLGPCVCVHLGLHTSSLENLRRLHVGPLGDNQERGNRHDPVHVNNRAFWAAFNTDRMATTLMGRYCMLPTSRGRAMRLADSHGSLPSPAEVVFQCQTRVWHIHDLHMDLIYAFDFEKSPLPERLRLLLDAREELDEFTRSLPPEACLKQQELPQSHERQLHSSRANPIDVVVLHMVHHMTCLQIHRPYLKNTFSDATRSMAFRASIDSATQIANLVRSPPSTCSWDKAPFIVVHCALTAAISLLLGVAWPRSEHGSRGQMVWRLRNCIEALAAMSSRWMRARRAIILLRQLAQRWGIMAVMPIRFSNPVNEDDASNTVDQGHPRLAPLATATGTPLLREELAGTLDHDLFAPSDLAGAWSSDWADPDFAWNQSLDWTTAGMPDLDMGN